MKQLNHQRTRKKDNAISSVVGEILLLAIGIMLVAIFSLSLMNILPEDRDMHVSVSMDASTEDEMIKFWHKGGDTISKDSLRVIVSNGSELSQIRTCEFINLTDSAGHPSPIFDLGGCYQIHVLNLSVGDQVRLMTEKTIIYAGETGA